MTPFNWISTVGQLSHDEMWEEVKENDYGFIENLDTIEEKHEIKVESLPTDSINLFDPLQTDYYKDNKKVQSVLKYISDRRLNTAANKPDALYMSLKDHSHKNRLVIPFKNSKGKIVFYQSRKILDEDGPKYLSKIFSDKTICGLDKVSDTLNSVFIFEGPIDSFFVKNGLGLAGINGGVESLTITQEDQLNDLQFYDKIWVLDSQWLDKTSRDKTKVLLEQGEKVFIWPKQYGLQYKDINELCVARGLDQISPDFIQKYSTHGKSAVLKFNMTFGKA